VRFPPLFIVVLLSVAIAGCSSGQQDPRGEAQRGGSVTVDLAGPVGSLDPALAHNREALRAAWLVYTPPLTYKRAGGREGLKVVPGVARSLPDVSEDELTWKLTIRPGLSYSDGRPLRARDFERGIARSLRLDPGRALKRFGSIVGAREFALGRGRSADIAGITTDESTGEVQLELDEPDSQLRYALASPQAAPVPAGTRLNTTRRLPAGIGPFSVRRSSPRSFTLARVDRFRIDGIPVAAVDSVSGRAVSGASRRTRRVLSDRSDATEGEAPVTLLPSLRSEYGSRYGEAATLRVLHVRLDERHRPFSDPDARRAVSYALDVRALGQIWAGLLEPACNLLPPQLPDYRRTEDCPFGRRQGDSELIKARNLIERSPARNARVLVWGGADRRGGQLASYLADQLTDIGMRARVARTAAERRRARAVFGSRIGADPDPAAYLDLPPGESPEEADWPALDREAVADGTVAPYGVATDGVLLSKRLDSGNCRRVHPLYGLDYSSLCLR
jgi:peptide/nickel transport system substrate-binding protein